MILTYEEKHARALLKLGAHNLCEPRVWIKYELGMSFASHALTA